MTGRNFRRLPGGGGGRSWDVRKSYTVVFVLFQFLLLSTSSSYGDDLSSSNSIIVAVVFVQLLGVEKKGPLLA